MLSPEAFPYGFSFMGVVFPNDFPLRIFLKEPPNASKCILRTFPSGFSLRMHPNASRCIQVHPGVYIFPENTRSDNRKLSRRIGRGLTKMYFFCLNLSFPFSSVRKRCWRKRNFYKTTGNLIRGVAR